MLEERLTDLQGVGTLGGAGVRDSTGEYSGIPRLDLGTFPDRPRSNRS
jgi:hypothetical protein